MPVNHSISGERVAENQSLYRTINERIKELNQVFAEIAALPGDWVCECADPDCTRRISATLLEYESVRSNPRAFIVYPGHIFPKVEAVVSENERFAIVETIGDAGIVAEQLAPRPAD